uniref:Reverse transcriptase zinc-binding domain-containing protein n=1 Tax=Fagus sylvatica TaxID=28930 RepID=A0A2N9IKB6_FAGSY
MTPSQGRLFPLEEHLEGKVPPRVAFFTWTAALGRILTVDNLRHRRVILFNWCCMCKADGESIDHLLLHCVYAKELWDMVFAMFGICWVMPGRGLQVSTYVASTFVHEEELIVEPKQPVLEDTQLDEVDKIGTMVFSTAEENMVSFGTLHPNIDFVIPNIFIDVVDPKALLLFVLPKVVPAFKQASSSRFSSFHTLKLEIQNSGPHSSLDSTIDQGPYVNVAEDGMVAAMCNEQNRDDSIEEIHELQNVHYEKDNKMVSDAKQDAHMTKGKDDVFPVRAETTIHATSVQDDKPHDVISPVRKCLDLLSQRNRWSMWLLAYIAITTSWPLVGSAFNIVFKKKLRNVLPTAFFRNHSLK